MSCIVPGLADGPGCGVVPQASAPRPSTARAGEGRACAGSGCSMLAGQPDPFCIPRILCSRDFHFCGREKSHVATPPIGNRNPLYLGKSIHLFIFFFAKIKCRTK